MTRTALLLLALFAAGAAIGFAAGSGDGPRGERRGPLAPEPMAGDPPADPVPLPPAQAAAPVAAPDPADLARPDAITGRVLTSRGSPVAGLHLIAVPVVAGGPRGEAVTAEDGWFRIGGLAGSGYFFETDRPGLLLDDGGKPVEPGGTVALVADPPIALPVRVLRPDGGMAERATLNGARHRPSWIVREHSWSPADPAFLLGEGLWEIFASAGADRDFWSESRLILLVPSETPAPVEIRLVASRGLRGRVVLPEGWSAGEIRVTHVEGGSCATTGPDKDWRYVLPGLPAGRATILVKAGSLSLARVEVVVGEGLAERDLVVGSDIPPGAFVLRAEGPSGRALPALDLAWASHPEPLPRLPDGGFLAPRPGGADGTIRVSTPALGERHVPVPPDAPEVRVRFTEPAFLEVDYGAIPGVHLIWLRSAGDHGNWRTIDRRRVDSSASPQRFGPLEPGPLRINAWTNGGIDVEDRVELRPGENHVALRMPVVFDLEVRLPPSAASGRLTVWYQDEPQTWCEEAATVADGEPIVFTGLPAGPCRLHLSGAGPADGEMELTLPTAGPVAFAADRRDALRVTVGSGDDALAEAGLLDGDLVVSIGGREFRTAREARALLDLAFTGSVVTLGVLRGGRRIELTVPGAILRDGRFLPVAR
jgi:hypothetical protein